MSLKKLLSIAATFVVFATVFPVSSFSKIDKDAYPIPKLDRVNIDGSREEWDRFSTITLLADPYGNRVESSDFHVTVNLAWCEDGLLVFTQVTDDTLQVDPTAAWKGDGIEYFLRDTMGSSNLIQYALTATNTEDPSNGILDFDYRSPDMTDVPIKYEVARASTESGYSIEALFCFSGVGMDRTVQGHSIGFQVFANDLDSAAEGNPLRYAWFYNSEVHTDPYAMYPLQLSDDRSFKVHYAVRPVITDNQSLDIFLIGDPEQPITIGRGMGNPIELTSDRPISTEASVLKEHSWQVIQNAKVVGEINRLQVPKKYVTTEEPHRFTDSIERFEAQDAENFPPKNALLAIGSSSIRKWQSIHNDLKADTIISRGFGGSTMEDALYFMDRIVLPYEPSKILLYEGENDLASGTSPEAFLKSLKTFVTRVHAKLPDTVIYFLSIKPSPRRAELQATIDRANKLAKEFANKTKHVEYIDVATPLLDGHGKARPELYLSDALHLNRDGYAIWAKIINQALE